MRGQVNLLLLALVSGAAASLVRGRSFRAGVWLAGAVCLKIIPAFLVVLPLWRRDFRLLGGLAVGLAVGLALVPLAVLGPARTLDCYGRLHTVMIAPGLGVGGDESRAKELINVTATDSQSILAVLHNTLHPDPADRPAKASSSVRLVSYVLGGAMTLLTLLAAGRRRPADPVSSVLLWGGLLIDMILLSPVCHLHYFSLAVPLVMGLIADRWQRRPTLAPGPGLLSLFVLGALANLLPQFPSMNAVRDGGLAMYATLSLWLVSMVVLWKREHTPATSAEPAGALAVLATSRGQP
jgi:hypothetical protein